jgi:formate dehydrogenase subunit delta
MKTIDRLVHMANQIAANLATEDDPIAATAEHIRLFWDPRMKAMMAAHDKTGLSEIAAAAVAVQT